MAQKTISEKILLKTMDWAYEKAVYGAGKLQNAEELAREFELNATSKKKAVNKLITSHNIKAASAGFLAGLPGLLATPVTIPANIAAVMYLQIRMICAIAVLGGYNVKDEKIKELVYLCLAGNTAAEIMKDATLSIEKRVAEKVLQSLSTKSINSFNQKAGFRVMQAVSPKLITRFTKALPVVSGVIGGLYDLRQTNHVAKLAKDTFFED